MPDDRTDFQPIRTPRMPDGYLASSTYVNKIYDAVEGRSGSATLGQRRPRREPPFFFLGQITDSGPNGESDYTDMRYWIKPQTGGGGLVDNVWNTADGGHGFDKEKIIIAKNMAELNEDGIVDPDHTHWMRVNDVVLCWIEGGDVSDIVHYIFDAPWRLYHKPLTKDGGSDGTNSAVATYTYTITHQVVNYTGISPIWQRPIGSVKVATYGWIYFTGTTAKMISCDEVPNVLACA